MRKRTRKEIEIISLFTFSSSITRQSPCNGKHGNGEGLTEEDDINATIEWMEAAKMQLEGNHQAAPYRQ